MTRRRLHLALVAVVVTAVHAAIFFTEVTRGTFDTDSYLMPARALARSGEFLSVDHVSYPMDQMYGGPTAVKPDTIRTPGYPLLLVLTGISVERVVVLQHLLDILLSLGIYLFVEATLDLPRAALIAALFYGCDPPVVELANRCMADEPFTFVLALAAAATYALLARRSLRWAVAAGLTLGIAVLIRPVALYLFLPLTIVIAFRQRKLALAFCIAAVVLPGTWAMRNASRAGVFTVTSISGDNALFFRAAGVLATEGWSAPEVLLAQQRHATRLHDGIVRVRPALLRDARASDANFDALNHAQRSRIYTRQALAIVAQHPIRTVELLFSGIVELYFFAIPPLASVGSVDFATMRLLLLPGNAALLVLAVYGFVVLRRRDRTMFAVLLTIVLYLTIVSADVEVGYRFFVPIAPAYGIAVALGLDQALASARARRDGRPGPS